MYYNNYFMYVQIHLCIFTVYASPFADMIGAQCEEQVADHSGHYRLGFCHSGHMTWIIL